MNNTLDILIQKILKINSNREIKFNCIIMPIAIYNIVFDCSKFIPIKFDSIKKLTKVGLFLECEVYLDMMMDTNTILLLYNKSVCRDVKLNSILNGVTEIETIKKIKIL